MRIQTSAIAAVMLLCACTGGLGSSRGSSAADQDQSVSSSTPWGTSDPALVEQGEINNPFITNGAAVMKGIDAVEKLSGKPLRVIDIHGSGGLYMQVQEPKNHINVDQYVVGYDGQVSGPEPIHLMSIDTVTAHLVDSQAFDPRTINFARLHDAAKEALAKAKLPDSHISHWVFTKDQRSIFVESPRNDATANMTPELTIMSIDKD